MNIEIVVAKVEGKEILRNLIEKYNYEFSQYDLRDVNDLGLYGYNYLDCYWYEENRFAFFIKVDGKLAGFVMVNNFPEADVPTDYSMSEFFVMYKYRRCGVGKYAAFAVLDMFKGKWQLKRHPNNIASVYFWDKVISEYTNGNYKLIKNYPNTEYENVTPGDIFFFET